MLNIRVDPEDFFRRLLLIARGLGFVFLVYFIPVMAREIASRSLPGGGFAGAISGDPEGPWVPLVTSLATFVVSAAFVRLHARTGEGADRPRPLLTLGSRAVTEAVTGLLLGAASVTAAVVPLVIGGALAISSRPAGVGREPLAVIAVVALLLVEAAREEMGFRGPGQRDLSNATRALPAGIFLAGSFALIHLANPSMTRPGLVGVFLAGVALAGIVRTRGDLWMACGFHAGWNVCLGLVWSVPVSGHPLADAAFATTIRAPFWTGGPVGPEGGPTGILVLAILAIAAWTRRPAADPFPQRATPADPPAPLS